MAILDNDEKYALKLMEFINHMKDTLFIASVFTRVAEYLAYSKIHEVDILLCSEECIDSISLDESNDVVFLLSKIDKEDIDRGRTIHKYQSAVRIYNKIVSLYDSQMIKDKPYNICEDAVINGIIPLFSHELCFYIGALSADYCSQQNRTLYVNFDPFFTPKIFGCEEAESGITEGICMLKSKPEGYIEHLGGMLLHIRGCDIFGGCTQWADSTEIEEEEATLLVQKLMENKSYERVIIDFGGLYRMASGLFKLCQRLYLPKPFNDYENERMKAFVRQTELIGVSIKEKVRYLSLHNINVEDINSSLYKEDMLTQLRKSRLVDIVENIYES